jgi:hypothetical protein
VPVSTEYDALVVTGERRASIVSTVRTSVRHTSGLTRQRR